MQVNVTLSFASVDEMLAHFGNANPGFKIVTELPKTAPAPTVTELAASAKPRGRPSKAKVEADDIVIPKATVAPLDVKKGDELPESMQADPEPTMAQAMVEAVPLKTYTLDDAKAAMKAFSEKYGIDALRAKLVETVGAARISDVPPEKYGTLIDQMTKDLAP
jgi:hypothetical protein